MVHREAYLTGQERRHPAAKSWSADLSNGVAAAAIHREYYYPHVCHSEFLFP